MRSRATYVFIAIMGVWLTGCRQADGPVPTPDENTKAELGDVAEDLQNIASGRDPQAPEDLASDLSKYPRSKDVLPVVDALSLQTSKVVAGKALNDQVSQRLAHSLWLSIAAREMSARQVESLQN